MINRKNSFSHLTAKERTVVSFPTRWLFEKGYINGKVLDFGCGHGVDIRYLAEKGIEVTGYDKHYQPHYPEEKFDIIICHYVLNVLLPEEQAKVLMEVSELLNPWGKAYFTVRRDIRYEGFRIHKLHQKPTYQCLVRLPYRSILKTESCEIYEYQHYKGIGQQEGAECPFCELDADHQLITESATAYAIFDKYPVSEGHALIIPKRHVANYFELSFKEQSACWLVLNRAREIIQENYQPQGFNIGVNIGYVAGQTVHHVHIHLIPRYEGDVPAPEGGVRGVIPGKQKY
jgi:diadenosine tetraphosphate (Ap4A) HIT family hydrolase